MYPKWLKEYCYTMDYNFYRNNGKTFTQITRKEYKEKTGESDYIIYKLRNSLFPVQINDYFFKKIEHLSKQYYAPVDWKLYNLDKYLNSIGFETHQTDQGNIMKFGVIQLANNKKLKPFLLEKFGENNIIYLNRVTDYTKNKGFINHDWYDEKLYGKKIVMASQTNIFENNKKFSHAAIYFKEKMIPWMYEKLNITMADHSKAHSGGRIISERDKKILNL